MTSLIVFLLTVLLVVWQPRGLKPAFGACVGALLALLLSVVHLPDLATVWNATWNATLTLVGLIVISLLLDKAGFFRFLALHVARWGRGQGVRLFVLLILFASVISAFFANDGGILILTPIALELADTLKLDRAATLAFAFAVGFVVDATSLPLTISNLVNIVVADALHLGFAPYAARILPVDLVAVIATLGVLLLLYRRSVPRVYDVQALPEPASAVRSRAVFITGGVVLPLLLAGYFLAGPLHVPLCLVTGSGAAAVWIYAGRSKAFSSREVLKHAPWDVVLFSLGMYLVVYGLRSGGWTHQYAGLIGSAQAHGEAAGVFTVGLSVAALSAFMNNLPAVLFATLGLQDAHLPVAAQTTLSLAAVTGADIGPKLTPIGSLATLLWLTMLRAKNIEVTWAEYFQIGWRLTLPVLLAALTALAVLSAKAG
ncbi:arsenical efflux pump membrane protein ArsB (plasmid) [Deinococcus radiomollis]|uniref:arsenical efflux pump membrane protein ArsB n=1 Tax=Deinococcus radiomollis TaxID=468916 RepID=UPI00389240E4